MPMEELIFDGSFFASLQRIRLASRLKLNSGMGGSRKSSAKGSSVEFADFREYMLGDDIRRIDWNAYGRMDRLFIKLFQEEKEGRFHVLLDCSGSMAYGEPKKSVLAQQIAGMFAYMVLNNLDRFSFYPLTGQERASLPSLKGQTGRQAFMKVLDAISRCDFAGRTDLLSSVKQIPFGGKGVAILITDGFDRDVNTFCEVIKYLAYEKQEVILVHVLAREELEPDFAGTWDLVDKETSSSIKITATRKLMNQYSRSMKQFAARVEADCKKYSSHYIGVSTGQALEQFVYEGVRRGQLVKI